MSDSENSQDLFNWLADNEPGFKEGDTPIQSVPNKIGVKDSTLGDVDFQAVLTMVEANHSGEIIYPRGGGYSILKGSQYIERATPKAHVKAIARPVDGKLASADRVVCSHDGYAVMVVDGSRATVNNEYAPDMIAARFAYNRVRAFKREETIQHFHSQLLFNTDSEIGEYGESVSIAGLEIDDSDETVKVFGAGNAVIIRVNEKGKLQRFFFPGSFDSGLVDDAFAMIQDTEYDTYENFQEAGIDPQQLNAKFQEISSIITSGDGVEIKYSKIMSRLSDCDVPEKARSFYSYQLANKTEIEGEKVDVLFLMARMYSSKKLETPHIAIGKKNVTNWGVKGHSYTISYKPGDRFIVGTEDILDFPAELVRDIVLKDDPHYASLKLLSILNIIDRESERDAAFAILQTKDVKSTNGNKN